MGYSLNDLYRDKILPKLKELVSKNEEGNFDDFIKIIKEASNSLKANAFKEIMINSIINPIDGYETTHGFIRDIFIHCCPDVELRYLEYKDGFAIISADFREENKYDMEESS